MKLKRLTLGVATCFLLALMTIPGLPKNGRDFAGTYSTSDVSQSGDNYTLTFSAKVFNYSGEDISNATIRLVDSMLPIRTFNREGVHLAYGADVPAFPSHSPLAT